MFPFMATAALLVLLPERTVTTSLAIEDDVMHSVHQYNSTRDYLHVTSENYPATYPGGHSYTWEWTAQGGGHWGVYFEDFDLACYPQNDALIIVDTGSDKKYMFRCQTTPNQLYFQSSFSMKLIAETRAADTQARGFKCHVLYAETKDGVEAKINQMKGSRRKPADTSKGDSPVLSGTEVALILIIVFLIVAVSVAHCVIKRRRQHHQHTTSTSVTVNIDSVRRDSSVSYTRGGVARLRFDSVDDTAPSSRIVARPNKRSESNASWAQRATSAGTGNGTGSGCVSKEQAQQRGSPRAAGNHYSPLPVGDSAQQQQQQQQQQQPRQKQQKVSINIRSQRSGPSRGLGAVLRSDSVLSAISEETSDAALNASCLLEEESGEEEEVTVCAVGGFTATDPAAGSGYICMTSCAQTDYINMGGEMRQSRDY